MASIYEHLTGGLGFPQDNGGAKTDNTGTFQSSKTNINPNKVNAYQPNVKRVKELQNLGTKTTKAQVVAVGKEALRMKSNNFKVAKLAANQLQVIREADRAIQIGMNYQAGVAASLESIENNTAQFGIKMKQSELNRDVINEGYAAFVDDFDSGQALTSASLSGW